MPKISDKEILNKIKNNPKLICLVVYGQNVNTAQQYR